MSLFETVLRILDEDKDLQDVATSVSLSVAGELCRVSLCVKTRKLLCNTDNKCGINIRYEKELNNFRFVCNFAVNY